MGADGERGKASLWRVLRVRKGQALILLGRIDVGDFANGGGTGV